MKRSIPYFYDKIRQLGNIRDIDEQYMRRCFDLARLGNSYVAPNPMVGAVLVHEERIIGEGWHQKFGSAHAEVNCLDSVKPEDKHLIEQSTLYVSLEPCAHYGKTPPCSDTIIENKILRVVISVIDPHIMAKQTGIQKLKEAGVDVVTGVLEKEGRELLKHFLSFHEKKRPYITLKWAQTADGFIGREGQRIKISNELTDRFVHQLRGDHESILVGKNTFLRDDPELTVRLVNAKSPVRVILATDGVIPDNAKIRKHASGYTIVLNENMAHADDHFEWIKVKSTRDIKLLLHALHEIKIISVLVEGGAKVLNSFLQSGFWDDAVVIRSDKTLDDGIASPQVHGHLAQEFNMENDHITIWKNPHDLSFT